ncbi:MAG: hypothetical protein ACRDSK_18970 [Actinophytocola sp.]|uniref:hypothetical protein n=1 Tax=Actinophytocola sp. TaxID=1872138 RepID=UPI003D6BFD0D
MFELDVADTQWTDEARESFRTAAAELVEAIRQHSAALLEMAGTDADVEAIAEAGEQLEAAATVYADKQFEFTGTVPPLGLDEEDDYSYEDYESDESSDESAEDYEDSDSSESSEEAAEPGATVTVLHRADFVVTDELAVIQAGKEAYYESWDPAEDSEDSEDAADVTDLGDALQQIQQAGGVEALADTPGLVSAGATTWMLEAADLLDERDPDEWPDSPFALGEDTPQRLMYRLDEVAS